MPVKLQIQKAKADISLWLLSFKAMFEIQNMGFLDMILLEKLKMIRGHLGLTQDQMAAKLGMTEESRRSRISEFETGKNEPKRNTLILYAELSNISIQGLIDDREEIILG